VYRLYYGHFAWDVPKATLTVAAAGSIHTRNF
jgi:hypothetical protein